MAGHSLNVYFWFYKIWPYGLAGLLGLLLGLLWTLGRFQALKTQLAVNAEKLSRIPLLENQLDEKNFKLETLQGELVMLKVLLEEERRTMGEKIELLAKAETQLTVQFENLANKILDEKTQKFSEQNQLQLNGLLHPFKEQMGEFRKKVDELHVDEIKDRAALRQEIAGLRQQTQQINQEAINLTKALKGDKKVQGAWGELILEKVLEQSGLRKGIEYQTQEGYRDSDQKLFKPDVIVHLPEGKDVVIDSKVSLIAYERYASLEDGDERDIALREHIQAIRNHVKSLAQKDYANLKGLRSLDFILLFMPIEAAFMLAFQQDDRLFNEAFANQIIIVTPTTLLATLRTIENIWRYERQNENAERITAKAGAVYNKLRSFLEDFEKVGQQLHAAHKSYDDAMNKLTLGRGNLIRQAESFVELGVKVNKNLPKTFTDQAELNDEDLSV